MLRDADLPLRLQGGRAYLDYLGPQDEPWVRALLGELARFEGRRARELAERLAEPLPCASPYFKRRAASRVLWSLWRRERLAEIPPQKVRAELFAEAAAAPVPDRARVLDAVAARLQTTPAVLERCLLGDVPGERIVRGPEPLPSATEATSLTNLAIAQTVLMRSSSVAIHLEGSARAIVRLAKLRGLLVNVVAPAGGGSPALQISGPFSLFRHTLLYGRALAELLPHLAWCARFELRASASLRGRPVEVHIDSGDPIRPARPPRPFDSRLETRFARDFARLAPDWELIREPEPLCAGKTLVFPDFLLRHRIQRQRALLVEIVGFWTAAYLVDKLARLRLVGVPVLLCIDADRGCATEDLPPHLPVLRFRRRVDAAAVLRFAEEHGGQAAPT